MFECIRCGAHFDDPEYHYESHGFTDGLYEKWSACPHCGCDDITAAGCEEDFSDINDEEVDD